TSTDTGEVDNKAPTVSAGFLSASEASCTGAGSTICKIGDTIRFTWNNTAGGDNSGADNGDIPVGGVVADLQGFGGGASVTMYDDGATGGDLIGGDGVWTIDFVVLADDDDGDNTFDVTVTDD